MGNSSKKYYKWYIIITIILMVFSLMIIAPYIWMMLTSFKSTREVLYNPGKVMPIKWTLSGYITVLTKSPFFSWFKNSGIVSVAVTAAVIFTSTITGYVFSKYRFKGKNILFWLVLSTMMVPSQITMIPRFLIINQVGLYNSLQALIIPALVSGFGIYLCRQFCDDIPDSLCEAAKLDGAGDFRIYASIIMPQLRPCIAALAIFTFLDIWNDYLNPLIMLSSLKSMTLPLALTYFSDAHSTDISAVMAASALIMLPVTILLLCFQKQFIKGVTISGMK